MTRLSAFCVTLAAFLVSCVDTTPIHVNEVHPDAGHGTSPDAATTTDQCRGCLVEDGGGCHSDYEICLGLPRCGEFVDCVFTYGCLRFPQLEDRLTCANPCINGLNLTSTDPALPGILAVNLCTQDKCRTACVVE